MIPPSSNIDAGLNIAAGRLGGTLVGMVRYGWNRKSAGSEIQLREERYWLKVEFTKEEHVGGRLWNGELEAAAIKGVNKPSVLDTVQWTSEGYLWRGLLMTLAGGGLCSPTPDMRTSLSFEKSWFQDLKRSLVALSGVPTERTNTRQNLIDRRIHERFGTRVPTTVVKWTTCHGDLHWANLTHPNLMILDWEGWGAGPYGLDAALLLAYSVMQEDVYEAVWDEFEHQLRDEDGLKATLFVCAELLRMIDLYNDHPDMASRIFGLAEQTLGTMRLR